MLLQTILLVLIPSVVSLTITVSSRSKFCFYEDIKVAHKALEGAEHATLTFTVLRGGKYKDIAVTVTSTHVQTSTVTHVSGRKVSQGKHAVSLSSGSYAICFDNSFSVVTEKVVEFRWEMPKKNRGVPSAKTALEYSAHGIKMKVLNMTMALKQQRHRTISSSENADFLNSKVSVCSMIAVLVIVSTALAETFALRRMFLTRPKTNC